QEVRVVEHCSLYDFRKAAEELAVRQRCQEIGAYANLACGVKGANHVFMRSEVHSRLAAEGCVDHGEQRCGHQRQPESAHVDRGGKGSEIGYYTATNAYHP